MNFVRENFSSVWPAHVEGMSAFLTRLRAAFDGDLDAALIMSVIGSSAVPKQGSNDIKSFEEHTNGQNRFQNFGAVNTLSIATITGIPRETVRRKVVAMEKNGWLERNSDGCWRVTEQGAQDLKPMTEYSLDYVGRLFSAFLRIPSDGAR